MITLRDGGSAGFVTVTGQILMAAHSPSRAHKEPLCTFPYRSTYDAVLVLEPADDEAGRELSSRLEDVAHSKHTWRRGSAACPHGRAQDACPPVAIARMTGA
jgi:hypothetical protein